MPRIAAAAAVVGLALAAGRKPAVARIAPAEVGGIVAVEVAAEAVAKVAVEAATAEWGIVALRGSR